MSVAMQPIYTQIIASTTATVTFNNIPQTFTDLLILGTSLRDISTGTGSAVLRFNGNSSSTYSATRFYGIGSAGSGSGRQTNATYAWYGEAGEGGVSEFPCSNSIFIPSYTSAMPKTWLAESFRERDNTVTYMVTTSGLWRNSSPITSITLYPEQSGTSWSAGTKFTLYGLTRTGRRPKATGGQITFDGTYFYHAFKDVGSSTFVPNQDITTDILVIAGGGGGGGNNTGGGGGAGGVVYLSGQSLTSATSYTVTVGDGGEGGSGGGSEAECKGKNGSNSQFHTFTAAVGGGGGGAPNSFGYAGGSGGGGGAGGAAGAPFLGGNGTSGQGNTGGSGTNAVSYGAGGGGGAGAVGSNGTGTNGGSGGNGTSSYSLWGLMTGTGQDVSGTWWYAGGGGGGLQNGSGSGGSGGNGGGGAGNKISAAATPGTANTGGGGGGLGYNGTVGIDNRSAKGGSGVVIVRYTA